MNRAFKDPQLEEALRRLFEPRQPSNGFLERLMERVAEAERAQGTVQPRRLAGVRRLWRWAAAAAVLLGLFAGAARYRRVQEARAQQAAEQAVLALSIAHEQLLEIRRTVLETIARQVRGIARPVSQESVRERQGGRT